MSQRRFLSTNQPTHTLPGRDSLRSPESSLTRPLGVGETSEISTPNYSKRLSDKSSFLFSLVLILSVYYRLYSEDGSIPSKTPAAPGDPFLGRIKARLVPPPHTVKAVKRCIAKMENIKDRTSHQGKSHIHICQ